MRITRKAMSSILGNGTSAKENRIVGGVVVREARAYRIRHSYDVRDLTAKYQIVLQLAINLIWKNISWEPVQVQNHYYVPNTKETMSLLKMQGKRFRIAGRRILVFYKATRLIPRIPKSAKFMRTLRNHLLSYWKQTRYAAHYVDSAIRTAYWIMKSWKRNYVNGRFGRKKPIVKKRFARIKNSLFRVKDGEVVLTVIPRQKYLRFRIKDKWFYSRVKDWKLGEIVLRDDEIILMFTREKERGKVKGVVGWDMNMFSMDGFWEKGYINISLRELYSIHITYHNKRRKVQRLAKTKPGYAKKLLKKISEREQNRTKDMIHKLTAEIAKKYKGYVHVLEDLEKENMYSGSRKHNRSIALHNWREIVSILKYKAETTEIDPRNTTRTCSRCGSTDTIVKNGTVTCRRCGLRINRQLNAAINIYLKGNSLRPSPETWSRLIEPRLRM